MNADIFDTIIELPNDAIQSRAKSLIGFRMKFQRVYTNLRMLVDQEGLKKWNVDFHNGKLPILSSMIDRHPLVILEGDPGTGKTVCAEGFADAIIRETKKEGYFLKLSTRVRGDGVHGQMGILVNDAFARLMQEAGKKKTAFLLIDEADAIATTRSTLQMHEEAKSAVNTLIQKLDEVRTLGGRAIVFMSTNRLHFIDEAIVRRAAMVIRFERPSFEERVELFRRDLEGVTLSDEQVENLATITGNGAHNEVGYSFSDLRLRLLPEAIAKAYPNEALTYETILKTISEVKPSPTIK